MIDALLEAVGPGGTVLVPTLTGNETLSPAHPPVFDPTRTPCWTGAIPEAFRKRPAAVRSQHPHPLGGGHWATGRGVHPGPCALGHAVRRAVALRPAGRARRQLRAAARREPPEQHPVPLRRGNGRRRLSHAGRICEGDARRGRPGSLPARDAAPVRHAASASTSWSPCLSSVASSAPARSGRRRFAWFTFRAWCARPCAAWPPTRASSADQNRGRPAAEQSRLSKRRAERSIQPGVAIDSPADVGCGLTAETVSRPCPPSPILAHVSAQADGAIEDQDTIGRIRVHAEITHAETGSERRARRRPGRVRPCSR